MCVYENTHSHESASKKAFQLIPKVFIRSHHIQKTLFLVAFYDSATESFDMPYSTVCIRIFIGNMFDFMHMQLKESNLFIRSVLLTIKCSFMRLI